MNQRKLSKGFTLIELLTVVAVLGTVGSILFGVLFTTLRGAGKSESLTVVQQNGTSALNQISRMVTFAKKLDVPASCYISSSQTSVTTSSITITNLDDRQTTFACSGSTLSSNSAALIDTTKVGVASCSFTCSQATAYDVPILTIDFTLTKTSAGSLLENTAVVPFKTSVTLRNIQK